MKDSDGDFVKIIEKKGWAGIFGRVARQVFDKDSYFVRDAGATVDGGETETSLAIEETWASAILPFVRKYNIIDPESDERIGEIKNTFTKNKFAGTEIYQIDIGDGHMDDVDLEELALVMRVIDNIEDR